METMTDFHGFVVVEDEPLAHIASTELLLFNFWRSFIDLTKEIPGNGGVAQLGEHLPCKQGVMGSNPIISTISGSKDA